MDPYSEPGFDPDPDEGWELAHRGARPLRWIGALAVFGVVAAALGVLAWEAAVESFEFIGEGEDEPVVVGAPDAEAPQAPDDTQVAEPAEDPEVEQDESGEQVYTVQPGDTGSTIAQEFYGTQNAWEDIAEYNDLDPTGTLNVGQELRLPPQ